MDLPEVLLNLDFSGLGAVPLARKGSGFSPGAIAPAARLWFFKQGVALARKGS